jgi:ATP-binding cassette, subfamily B, bacterial
MPSSRAPAHEYGVEEPDERPVTRQRIRPGTVRRIIPYAKRYRWPLAVLMAFTAIDAGVTTINPLLFGVIIDKGITPGRLSIVVTVASIVAALAVTDAFATLMQTRISAKIGQGLVYDLRTQVFGHVQKQPLAFFTRSQTGSLVSRLNTDVVGAQEAITTLLSQTVDTLLTLSFVLAAMFYLSWQISLCAVVAIPLFIFPGKIIGRRLQRLTREQMQLNAELGSLITERFNVAGAMLVNLFGRPDDEAALIKNTAGRARDIGVQANVMMRMLGIIMTLSSSLVLALTFGLGGYFVVEHSFKIGTMVALVTLIGRIYAPINNISNMQANVLTSLVSFDRIFEILDLKPLVAERPGALALGVRSRDGKDAGSGAPEIEFDRVSFSYPSAKDVSLASLESIRRPAKERGGSNPRVLIDVSFRAPSGQLTALVGPSGAGKTTVTHMVPRFYDPDAGVVKINGHDIRDLTLQSVHETVGVVTQDAHLFHDTIRANLLFARPDASEHDLKEACRAAQIWNLIASLPDGLDTVAGDRGYRLSGGEKQRISLARLLLKAPPVVVLDEATAHLDLESEAAVQRALQTALAGRTSLVIAHRLSTIREADQIVVIDGGQVSQRGTHDELLAADGLYARLYHTHFARQAANGRESAEQQLQQASHSIEPRDQLVGGAAVAQPDMPRPAEARPGGQEHVLATVEPLAEIVGVRELFQPRKRGDPAGRRGEGDPVGGGCPVHQDLAIPGRLRHPRLEEVLQVSKHALGEQFDQGRQVQRGVVPDAHAVGEDVWRRDTPAETQPRQPEGLREGAEADPARVAPRHIRQRPLVIRQIGECGVPEQVRAGQVGLADYCPHVVFADGSTGRVVREVHHDGTRPAGNEAGQLVQRRGPAGAIRPQPPRLDAGASGGGEIDEQVISRLDSDHLVPRPQQCHQDQRDGLARAAGRHHLGRLAIAPPPPDRRPDAGRSERVAIAEDEGVEVRQLNSGLGPELRHRVRLDAA